MSAADHSYGNRDKLAGKRRALGAQDKFSFFLTFLIGAAGIVTLKAHFDAWQGYVLGWSIIWMIFYLLLVTAVPRYWLRLDQAGDNLYYLGFLYTLVSLSVALYSFTKAKAVLDQINQIISNFGIALATTILGIALRVVLHQMREDPIETEQQARLNLAEAANRLRSELDISVREMSSFVRQMKQSVEESLHAVGKHAGKLLEDSAAQIAQATQNASVGIGEALSTFTENAKTLNAASHRHVQTTEKLIKRIESIDVPTDLIDRKIAPVLEQIVNLVDAKLTLIENHAVESQSAVLREQVVIFEELRAKVRQQIEEFEVQLRDMREAGAGLILNSMRALADRQAETFERIAQQAEEGLEALRQSRQAMEHEVNQARGATREVMQHLASMVRTLERELAGQMSRSPRSD